MVDYSISKCTRKCALSGRELEPGEKYYSVILPAGESVTRIDIAASDWTGAKPEAIGWWRSQMPEAAAKKARPAPNGVLLDTLSELLERPGQEALAYLLALLLIRRRVLHQEEQLDDEAAAEVPTHWSLVCPADGRQWHLPLITPPVEMLPALQEQLKALLFTDE
ncbi:MAG: hypothetical protein KDA45_03555 [Planctomycetales bacterium]|nr:hypothetical protein [Planctomycetales bacterium]